MPRTTLEATVETALGVFRVGADDDAIRRLTWGAGGTQTSLLLLEAARQLQAYAEGRLAVFELPLAPQGSDFQRAVWREMVRIPHGRTKTYGDLAQAIDPKDWRGIARAVGAACGANPIPILIPCHRVVAGGGELGGFSGGGGSETKRRLLVHEGALFEQLSLL